MSSNKKLSALPAQALQSATEFYVQRNNTSGKTTLADIAASVAGEGLDLDDISDSATRLAMTSAERSKLIGIETGANNFTFEMPTGMIFPFGSDSAPVGYITCDGAEYSKVAYAALFAVVGTTWNTGGETTGFFRVPDLRGRTIVGVGSGGIGLTPRAIGDMGGEEDHLLTWNEMPVHGHGVVMGLEGGPSGSGSYDGNSHQSSITIATETAGGSVAHNTMQPFLAVHYIIKS